MGSATEIYDQGWVFGLVFLACPIGVFLTKYVLANRIKYFAGCISAGDITQTIFGDKSQIIVGILSFINGISSTVAQIVALGFVFNYLLGINTNFGMLIGGGIIVTYSAFGGVRSVITTDIIQFAVLVIAIPIVLNIAVSYIGGYEIFVTQIAYSQPEYQANDLWGYAIIFISFCIPRLYPAMIQRCLIARDAEQLNKSLNNTLIIITCTCVIVLSIGAASILLYPNAADSAHIFSYLVQDLIPIGLKGFVIAGLLAVIMSTADTELNAGSIALVHDVIKKISTTKIAESRLASITTFVMGMIAVITSMQFSSILDAMLFTYLLWYPIMICPLILGIYGLKSDDKTFITSTLITVVAVIIFHTTWSHDFALSTICGVIFNFVTFMTCHYFFNHAYKFEVREKPQEPEQPEDSNSFKLENITSLFNSLNKSYGSPYVAFGLFVIASYLFPHFMWEEKVEPFYSATIYLRFISGVGCIMLLMKDFWMPNQEKNFPRFWYANITFTLPFSTGFSLWVHDVNTFWLTMIGVVLLLITHLVDWVRCCVLTLIGLASSFVLYKLLGGSIASVPADNLYAASYLVITFVIIGVIFIQRKESTHKSILQEKDDIIEKQKIRLAYMSTKTNEALGVQKRILRNFSHELRTPMSSAITIADVLENDDLHGADREQAFGILNKSLNRFVNYIEDITTVSIAQNDSLPLTKTSTNLTELVRQAIKAFTELENPPKPIYIKTEEIEEIFADIDPNEIKRVLHSILDNAVRYSGDAVHITINVQRMGETRFKLSIADDGFGIPDDEKKTVFIPFVESTETRLETGGKGLGLAVSSAIIKSHDRSGYIEALDNPKGQGTLIEFSFTCLPKSWKNTIKQANKTVLMIDDDDSILLSHRFGFQRAGYTLIEAENGYIGLDMFKKYKNRIDIVIVDLMMPGFSGVEVMLQLEDQYPQHYQKLDVFLHTGAAEADYEYELKKLGNREKPTILHKPINSKQIMAVLEEDEE